MTDHTHSHAHRSPPLFWLAIISISWLDAALRLDYVAAFSNIISVGGLCSTLPIKSRCQAKVGLLSTKHAAADDDHHRHRHVRIFPLYMSTKDHQQDTSEKSTYTTEEQLQKRFEEAMQRRKERRSLTESSSLSESSDDPIAEPLSEKGEATTLIPPSDAVLGVEETSETTTKEHDIQTTIEAETAAVTKYDNDIKSNIRDGSISKDTFEADSSETREEDSEVKPTANNSPRQKKQPTMRNNDGSVRKEENRAKRRSPPKATVRPSSKNRSRRDDEVDEGKSIDNYRDREYDDEARYSLDDPYEDYDDDNYNNDDYDERYSSSRSAPACEWETYRSTSILFPPLSQLSKTGNVVPITTRPKAIIHFVGGTFFGSYPRKFYGSLLEDIATKCQAVVVATPIPLVLPGKGLVSKVGDWMFDEGGSERERRTRNNDRDSTNNPLDHVSLAETIQKEFNNAYRDVILDEYCADYVSDEEVEDFMKNVPIVGIGHSLGARIQAISCSHPRISQRYLSMGKGNKLIRSGREGMIYLGFANWGASSSIPGVATLDRTVKKRNQQGQRREQEEEDRRGRDRGAGRRDDIWDDRSRTRRRRSGDDNNDVRGRPRSSRYDRYDIEDDLDLADVFTDVVSSVAKGAKQIGEALTPESGDLEFSPTPNELWDDLSALDGSCTYSQSCQNNLIVQFDQDPIDQGSRLARTLLTAYNNAELNASANNDSSAESSDEKEDQGDKHNKQPLYDVKFARLSGGHLTPVTVQDGIAKMLPRAAVSLLSSSSNFILQQLDNERVGKSSQKQRREVKDVCDTVASYVESLSSDK